MFNYIRNNIIAGLFVTIPLLISVIIIIFIYEKLTSWSIALFIHIPWVKELANHLPFSELIKIISLILILLIVFFIGILTRNTLGRKIITFAEWFLMKVPMFNSVYSTIKNIGDAIRNQKNGMFRKVVLFEFPKKGIYSVGFVTNEDNLWETGNTDKKELISVFLPLTPNPTSGYFLLIPKADLTYLEVSVAEAMRLIISGGAITPGSDLNIPKV